MTLAPCEPVHRHRSCSLKMYESIKHPGLVTKQSK